MKVGIIGCGHIAAIHARAIKSIPDAQIIGVVDAFQDYARIFANQWEIPRIFKNVTQLVNEEKPDVVHVLTPPASHCDLVVECLQQKCHVLVEKPMALNVSDAQKMIDLAKRSGLGLSVNHNYRFEPVLRKAAEILAAGQLGKLVALDVSYGFDINRYPSLVQEGADLSNWVYRLNGGPLEDQMAHPASMVLEHVDHVKDLKILSQNRGILPKPWSDEIRVLIDAEPVHAQIYISYSIKPDSLVLTLRGTEGTARADLGSMTLTVELNSALPRAVTRGLTGFKRAFQELRGAGANIVKVATGQFDKTGGVKTVVEGFYHAIQHGEDPPVTMEEGKRVVDLIQHIWPRPVKEPLENDLADDLKGYTPTVHSPKQSRVLVTGASGFIGSHLIQRLQSQGTSVRALVRPNSYGIGFLKGMKIEIIEGDLSNPSIIQNAVDGIDTIYHVGAAMSGDWEIHRQSTVVGTQNIVDAALKAKVNRLVHFSSLVAYKVSGVLDGSVINEDWPLEDRAETLGPYTRAKVEAEKIVHNAFTSHNLPVSVVRPGIVIGPRGRIFFPHLGYMLQDKVFIVMKGGKTILPLVYIDHVINGALACVEHDEAIGKAYNLVDDSSITVLDYINRFGEVTKIPIKIVKVPYALPYCATAGYEMAAALGVLKKGVTSRPQLAWKHKTLHFPSDRAKNDLSWKCQVPIEEAMLNTFKWYKKVRK